MATGRTCQTDYTITECSKEEEVKTKNGQQNTTSITIDFTPRTPQKKPG
jgi:hypothetical protein